MLKQLNSLVKTTPEKIDQVKEDEDSEARQVRAFGLDLQAYYLNKKYYVQLRNGDCYRTR